MALVFCLKNFYRSSLLQYCIHFNRYGCYIWTGVPQDNFSDKKLLPDLLLDLSAWFYCQWKCCTLCQTSGNGWQVASLGIDCRRRGMGEVLYMPNIIPRRAQSVNASWQMLLQVSYSYCKRDQRWMENFTGRMLVQILAGAFVSDYFCSLLRTGLIHGCWKWDRLWGKAHTICKPRCGCIAGNNVAMKKWLLCN